MSEQPAIVAFVEARYDELEAAAKAATRGPWEVTRDEETEKTTVRTQAGWFEEYGRRLYGVRPIAELAEGNLVEADAELIALNDPAYVLDDIAVKRLIVAEHPLYTGGHEECCKTCSTEDYAGALVGEWPCPTLRLLAAPFAGHPDYDPAWTVDR